MKYHTLYRSPVLLVIFYLYGQLSYAQSEKDSLAIIRLLEEDDATWRMGDLQGHADCWVEHPNTLIRLLLIQNHISLFLLKHSK